MGLPVLVSLLAAPLAAQSNVDPTIDVRLALLEELDALGREGTFPNGVNAAAMSTTVCNQGGEVEWFAPMDPRHPVIAFLIAREDANGRFEQISDRSFLKHGFFAVTGSDCGPCTPPSGAGFGDFLGVGCSDTYSLASNGNDFWLGPADEIDPWLGSWDPQCSFFDLGLTGSSCDGSRSFSQTQANTLGPVGNRIRLSDVDLNVAGASFWYQAQYVVPKEAEAVRTDNIGSRPFTPIWTGSTWDLVESGTLQHGSVLERWSGATVRSATNGGDDGRVHIGVRVTGPNDGLYHYELALHNRDNARGIDELRLPLCSGARILNPWFGDLDANAANDWVASIESGGTELIFRDPGTTNALAWNTIYNVAFDSDAAPADGGALLRQATAGTGAPSFSVVLPAPLELYAPFTGAGCSLDGTPPTLFATGSPPRASLGNASLALESTGNVPGQLSVLVTTNAPGTGSIPIQACTFWLQGPFDQLYAFASTTADASGRAVHPTPVPANPFFEGVDLRFQCLSVNPGGGASFSIFDFSDGLELRIGDAIPGCGN